MIWSQLKSDLKLMLPEAVRQFWGRRRLEAVRRRNVKRGAAEIFNEIYERNRWGGRRGAFCSGSGSSPEHAESYSRVVRAFIAEHQIGHVVDLGCGDFRIGAELAAGGVRYTGVDIVPALIESNRRLYGGDRVRFECLDIIEDVLPEGQLCLIRQVLQHLSNAQIARVLHNVAKYPYVIVTEHYPAPKAVRGKNFDKACGEDVRIYDGSAVYLDAPPFNLSAVGPLLDVDAGHCLMEPGERIRSYLLEGGRA